MSINEFFIGKKVIVRTNSAGVWFGVISQKEGNEVIVSQARRMYKWWCKKSISLSGVALYGVIHEKSKIVEPLEDIWLESIEIIPCSEDCIESLESAPHVEAE